jgi:hypothetical protein
LWFCAARDLQRERGEVASEQRRDGMSSKGRKEGRKKGRKEGRLTRAEFDGSCLSLHFISSQLIEF